MNYHDLAATIIKKVGGAKNIRSLVHCATRLRFELKNEKLADAGGLESIPEVLGIVKSQGMFQVVIGNDVSLVYNEIIAATGLDGKTEREEEVKNISFFDRVMKAISGIFVPYIGVLAATGILKGLLTLAVSTGVLDDTSTVYLALSGAGNAVFYFFPILLAFTAAKHFKANPYIGAVIAAALLEPSTVSIGEAGEVVSFLGIPMVVYSFAGTVFPVILSMLVYSYLEKWLNKVLPGAVKQIGTAFLCIVIMVPLTLLVFGPVGMIFNDLIANGYAFLNNASPVLANAIAAATFVFAVMFGFHMGLIAIMITNFAAYGQDTLIGATGLANYAMLGVMIGYMILSRNKTNRSVASAAGLSLFLSGISEPGLYGICIRYKKTFISIVTAGLIGGALYGLFGCYAVDFSFTGILGLAVFYTPKFHLYLIAVGVTIAIGTIMTFILGTGEEEEDKKINRYSLVSPVKGRVVPIRKVADELFAKETLGKGIAITPEDGKIYAPASGTVTSFFASKHAVGITTDDGVELLIHVGIDTVRLDGQYFTAKAAQGDRVKQGQELLEVDFEGIRDAGFDITTMLVVTNSGDYMDVISAGEEEIFPEEPLLTVVEEIQLERKGAVRWRRS